MRVLHVISGMDPRSGGPVTALEGLVRHQYRNPELEVTILTSYENGDSLDVIEKVQEMGIDVIRIGPVRGRLKTCPGMKEVVRNAVSHHDIIHVHGLWESVLNIAVSAAYQFKKPSFVRPCGMLDPWSMEQSKWQKRLARFLYLDRMIRRTTALHFTTGEERKLAQQFYRKQGVVVPNGIEIYKDAPLVDSHQFRKELEIDNDARIILFLSRLHEKKGLELLLTAFSKVAKGKETLLIVGEGENQYTDKIKSLVLKSRRKESIKLAGALHGDWKRRAYREAEILVLPSYQENFGNVVLESAMEGTPVLISKSVNLAQQVSSSGIGRVCDTSIQSVARNLRSFLDNDEALRKSAKRTQRFARRYQWSSIASHWNKLYRKAVNQ